MGVTTPNTTYKPFYVYCHNDGDSLVYVGKGSEGRAWACTGRKGNHKPFMDTRLNNGDQSFVNIIATNLTEQDAYELEELIIKEAQPIYNKFFTEEWKATNKERGLKGAEASSKPVNTPIGVFKSGREAARQLGIKQYSLYARIRSESENMKEYYYV